MGIDIDEDRLLDIENELNSSTPDCWGCIEFDKDDIEFLFESVHDLMLELTIAEDHNKQRLECIDEKGALKVRIRSLEEQVKFLTKEMARYKKAYEYEMYD